MRAISCLFRETILVHACKRVEGGELALVDFFFTFMIGLSRESIPAGSTGATGIEALEDTVEASLTIVGALAKAVRGGGETGLLVEEENRLNSFWPSEDSCGKVDLVLDILGEVSGEFDFEEEVEAHGDTGGIEQLELLLRAGESTVLAEILEGEEDAKLFKRSPASEAVVRTTDCNEPSFHTGFVTSSGERVANRDEIVIAASSCDKRPLWAELPLIGSTVSESSRNESPLKKRSSHGSKQLAWIRKPLGPPWGSAFFSSFVMLASLDREICSS